MGPAHGLVGSWALQSRALGLGWWARGAYKKLSTGEEVKQRCALQQ